MLVLVAATTALSNPLHGYTVSPSPFEVTGWVMKTRTVGPKPWHHMACSRVRSSAVMHMQSGDPTDAYAALLGVHPDATPAELRAAYRERAKQCHPDLNPTRAAAHEFRMLTEVNPHPANKTCNRRHDPSLTMYHPLACPWSRRHSSS